MSMQARTEVLAETIRATPPLAVAGLTVAGVSLNDVVLLITLVYLILQIGYLAHRWARLVISRGRPPKDVDE